ARVSKQTAGPTTSSPSGSCPITSTTQCDSCSWASAPVEETAGRGVAATTTTTTTAASQETLCHDMASPLRRFTTGVFAEAGDRVPWNQPPPHGEAPSGGGLQATSATSAGRPRLGQPAPATSGSRNSWNSDRLSSEPFL